MALYRVLWALHVLGGTVGLISMFVPLCSKKGSRLHRRAGTIFVVAMLAATLSGVVMAASWILAPEAFATGESFAERRTAGVFLATLGMLGTGGIQQMVRAVARKRQIAPNPSRLDLAWPAASIAVGLGAALVGLARANWLIVVFATLTIATSIGSLRFSLRPLPTPKSWWYQHMQGAMGSMLTAITAFVVFGGSRWVLAWIPAGLSWLPWIAPSALLVPGFAVWTRIYRRRFGELT